MAAAAAAARTVHGRRSPADARRLRSCGHVAHRATDDRTVVCAMPASTWGRRCGRIAQRAGRRRRRVAEHRRHRTGDGDVSTPARCGPAGRPRWPRSSGRLRCSCRPASARSSSVAARESAVGADDVSRHGSTGDGRPRPDDADVVAVRRRRRGGRRHRRSRPPTPRRRRRTARRLVLRRSSGARRAGPDSARAPCPSTWLVAGRPRWRAGAAAGAGELAPRRRRARTVVEPRLRSGEAMTRVGPAGCDARASCSSRPSTHRPTREHRRARRRPGRRLPAALRRPGRRAGRSRRRSPRSGSSPVACSGRARRRRPAFAQAAALGPRPGPRPRSCPTSGVASSISIRRPAPRTRRPLAGPRAAGRQRRRRAEGEVALARRRPSTSPGSCAAPCRRSAPLRLAARRHVPRDRWVRRPRRRRWRAGSSSRARGGSSCWAAPRSRRGSAWARPRRRHARPAGGWHRPAARGAPAPPCTSPPSTWATPTRCSAFLDAVPGRGLAADPRRLPHGGRVRRPARRRARAGRPASSSCGAKVVGAWMLSEQLPDLDHFVLFSSIAALLPMAGQGGYAAGNAFLDALAQPARPRRARPALSVDWGFWDGSATCAAGEAGQRRGGDSVGYKDAAATPGRGAGLRGFRADAGPRRARPPAARRRRRTSVVVPDRLGGVRRGAVGSAARPRRRAGRPSRVGAAPAARVARRLTLAEQLAAAPADERDDAGRGRCAPRSSAGC